MRAAALALLSERPMHGYEMIQELEERTDGVWRPSPGAVYPALQLLEDQGLVTADAEAGKRLFSLTDTGREEAAKAGDRKPWDDVTEGIDPTQFKLRDALGPIAMAARQVAMAGTPAQQAAAVEILAESRRKLYALLAEDPTTVPAPSRPTQNRRRSSGAPARSSSRSISTHTTPRLEANTFAWGLMRVATNMPTVGARLGSRSSRSW